MVDGARMSRAYDTEVVPLDDYENPYATPGYHNGIHNGNDMRTFRRHGVEPTQATQQPPKPPRSVAVETRETRERVAFNNDSSSVTDSTEKLARDFYRRKGGGATPYGEENPTFKT